MVKDRNLKHLVFVSPENGSPSKPSGFDNIKRRSDKHNRGGNCTSAVDSFDDEEGDYEISLQNLPMSGNTSMQ